MIQSRDEFEAALERLVTYLSSPPRTSSESYDEFRKLLEEVSGYRPSFTSSEDRTRFDELTARAAELTSAAQALVQRREDEVRNSGFAGLTRDGRGIGPTTGV